MGKRVDAEGENDYTYEGDEAEGYDNGNESDECEYDAGDEDGGEGVGGIECEHDVGGEDEGEDEGGEDEGEGEGEGVGGIEGYAGVEDEDEDEGEDGLSGMEGGDTTLGSTPTNSTTPTTSGTPAPGTPQVPAVPGAKLDTSGVTSQTQAVSANGKFSPPNTGPVDDEGFALEPPKGEMSPEERAKFAVKIADHLKKKFNLTDAQIAGIMGNLMLEGRFSPNMREGTKFGGGPSPMGMGIIQWTGQSPGERGYNFVKFCKENNLDINSESANVKFLDKELTNPDLDYGPAFDKFKVVLKTLQAHPEWTTEKTAEYWATDFENAATPNIDQRMKCAKNWTAFLHGDKTGFLNNLIQMDG